MLHMDRKWLVAEPAGCPFETQALMVVVVPPEVGP